MEFLLQNFPRDMIVFIRRVLFLALTTGLLIVIPLTYQVWKQWDSRDGYDEKLRWWIILRLVVFCSQLPLRKTIMDRLSSAEIAQDEIVMRMRLFQMTNETCWQWSQYLSIFICSWVLISFFVCGFVLPQTDLVTVLWWICWWTVGLIGFHLACAVYLLHQMLGFREQEMDFSQEVSGLTAKQLEPYSDVFSFDENDGSTICKVCDICFCDYENGDKIRRFHRCTHYFHQKCIDRWMRSHLKCPYCTQRVDQDSFSKLPEVDSGETETPEQIHDGEEDDLLDRIEDVRGQHLKTD